MKKFLPLYGETEGPLGFPMPSQAAQKLESLLKQHSKDAALQYRKAVVTLGPSEVLQGDRTDVSWISTQDVDRVGDVVIAAGMDDTHFAKNPLVTLQHSYHRPPVGKSVWRAKRKDGEMIGIKAKTQYPRKPDDYPGEEWLPDYAFSLIRADLMRGKSIGFLPIKAHAPTPEEIKSSPEWASAGIIIDEWLLLEYACCFLPMNQSSVVEQVSKAADTLPAPAIKLIEAEFGIDLSVTAPAEFPFTPIEEIEKALQRRFESIDIKILTQKAVQDALDRIQGRV
jgi:hypothetical protein